MIDIKVAGNEINPKQEGHDDKKEDEETTKKMLQKYVGPLTLELLKYYFTFESFTNTTCDSEELGNYGLYMLIKDQCKLNIKSLVTYTKISLFFRWSYCTRICRLRGTFFLPWIASCPLNHIYLSFFKSSGWHQRKNVQELIIH